MIVGSFIGDAATMGLHWIYNQNELAEKVKQNGGAAAFFEPPSCPFYQYQSGSLSPYGDEIIPFLHSFASEQSFVKESAAAASYDFFKSYSGRLNHVPKQFVANRDDGKAWDECSVVDSQAHGIIKMPLTVALYAGHESLLTRVEEVVSVLQQSPSSVEAAKLLALLMERSLLSSDSPSEALHWAKTHERVTPEMLRYISLVHDDELIAKWVHVVQALGNQPEKPYQRMRVIGKLVPQLLASQSVEGLAPGDDWDEADRLFLLSGLEYRDAHPLVAFSLQEAMLSLGLSCSLPGALLITLYIARKCSSFEDAIIQNLLAGGDNCSRSIVIGGLFGAWSGVSLPAAWTAKLRPELLEEVQAVAIRVVQANTKLVSLRFNKWL